MLGFTSFCVQMHPSAAVLWWVYFWVYSVFEVGVLFLDEEEWVWPDRPIRRSKELRRRKKPTAWAMEADFTSGLEHFS